MRQLTILILLLTVNYSSIAQTSLFGKVTDKETDEDLIGANVVIEQNGVFKAGTITDFNGIFKIDLDPGTYDIQVNMIGYPETRINNVIVKPGLNNRLDVQMDPGDLICLCCFSTEYKVPLIEIDNTASGLIQISQDIQRSSSRNTNDLILNTAGLSSASF